MQKLGVDLNYNIKLGLLLITSIIFFGACFDEEKKVKTKKTTKKLVNKVISIKDTNKTLSKVIEGDGIVVDGARDEELLDAFGLAVSQVIVEDGVSVPDCAALEKTGYLSKEECDEVSNKYFGFYEIKENGEGSKVDDVFKSGIAGEDINIRDSDTEFFDSSGNPLLDNQVEFDEVVSESDDLNLLNKLKEKIPKNKKELLDNINSKIELLEDRQVQSSVKKAQKEVEKKEKTNNSSNNTPTQADNSVVENTGNDTNYISLKSRLARLKEQNRKTANSLEVYPDDERLIDRYNYELSEIASIEAQLDL